MRLAYISADTGVPVFGSKGCSIHVQEVIAALRRRNVDVTLFTTRRGGEAPDHLGDVKVCTLSPANKSKFASREEASTATNSQLRDLLKREGSFDKVYERYSLWSYAGMEYARDHGIAGILEVNAPLIEEQLTHRTLLNPALAESTARRTFRAARSLLAVSKEVATYLEGYPQALGRIQVVSNGVDTRRFRPDVKASCAVDDSFTVGFAGSMRPWHGLEVLVEAFAQLHEKDCRSRLLIVGDGAARRDLESGLAGRGLLHSVRFTGAVSPAEVPALLVSMDVAVAPYPKLPTFYFSPLKVFEYMAAGRAIVAARAGALAELIEDGVNGLLFPAGDSAGLAERLSSLREAPMLRQRLGAAARADACQRHTWDSVVGTILSMAAQKAAPPIFAETQN